MVPQKPSGSVLLLGRAPPSTFHVTAGLLAAFTNAGAVEAIICALALQHGLLPGGVNTTQLDPALTLNYLLENRSQRVERVLTNSFGFGGSNCSLLFGLAP